jgi:ATP-dependent Clp protease ATP-binding subunit ClpA
MYDRFSERARKIMKLAYQESVRLKHGKIDTEHILFGFLKEGTGVGSNVIENLDVDLASVRRALEQSMPPAGTDAGGPSLPYTPAAKRILELAIEEAQGIEHNYVGSEHLLLGMLRESEGIAARVLIGAGLNLISVRHEIVEFLGLQSSDAKQFADVDRVLQMAANEAARCSGALIEPEHLLAGLVVYLDFEQRWGINFDAILRSLEKHLLPVSTIQRNRGILQIPTKSYGLLLRMPSN